MTDIYQLGISVDSTDVVDAKDDLNDLSTSATKASSSVDNLSASTNRGSTSAKKYGSSVSSASTKTKGLGRNAGQAGIQIQQMVGQVQGGVSPFVALSQQSADLGFVLGAPLVGVVVSLGAVLAGTLVAALGKTSESAEDLLERIGGLSDGFKELTEAQKAYAVTQKQIEIDAKAREIDSLSNSIVKLENEMAAANQMQQELAYSTSYGNVQGSVAKTAIEVEKLKAQLDTAAQEAAILNEELNDLGTPRAGESGSASTKTPWWGGDESVDQAAFDIRMQLWKTEQQTIVDDLAVRNDAFASYYEELATARAVSEEAAAERDIKLAQELEDKKQAIFDNALKDREEAARISEENKLKISQSFNTIFANMMESQSKEIFEIGKVGAATKAVTDAYGSINATLAQGGAFAWPAAIATGAAAFANVAKIMSTSYGQTSGSAGSAPSIPDAESASSTDTSTSSQTTINIAGEATQSVVDQLKDLFASDAVIISRGSAQARELNYG